MLVRPFALLSRRSASPSKRSLGGSAFPIFSIQRLHTSTRMSIASEAVAPPTPFYIPTIDIAPYIANPSSPEADGIIKEVRKACVSTGFFQITGHGVPRSLQTDVLDAAAAFFALPFEEKKKLDAKTTVGHRGYDLLASQSYEPGVLPDLKEGFYLGTNLAPSDPRVLARRFYMGSNVYPLPSVLPSHALQHPAEAYYRAVYDLALQVLRLIAATLPHGPGIFDRFMENDPAAPLRLLHYPPPPPASSAGAGGSEAQQQQRRRQLGASAHTDFGAITLLLQDGNPGLEVLDRTSSSSSSSGDDAGAQAQEGGEGETWVPIPPSDTGAYVVNVGDMLSLWTRGVYKSSVHRVRNRTPGVDRYSVVFFFDGNLDCRLDPLGGEEGEEKAERAVTVEEHMLRRMRESYGVGK